MKNYNLICLAPDGGKVTEGQFPSVKAAWERCYQMGSRWYFYPIPLVTGASRSPQARIIAVPNGMPTDFVGMTVGRFARLLAADSDRVCDWINGKHPFPFYP